MHAAEFESPPASFQTTPRPHDGERLAANPPCFVYPAVRNFQGYVVECSADREFPAAGTLRLRSPYMLVCPHEPLMPGTYYWRWRPPGERQWSVVRRFEVPRDVPRIPFPDIDALAQRVSGIHPRVQVGPGGVDELRRRTRELWGERGLQQAHRAALQARGRPLLPEPDFLPDPKDPRRRVLYQQTFQTMRPFFREMAAMGEIYLLTGDPVAGEQARRRLLHIVSWDPHGSTNIHHNDEVGTEVVRYCPTVYDRVYGLLSEDERRRCLDCFLIRMTDMRDRWRRRPFEKHPYGSHNMGYYLPDVLEASLAIVGDAPVEETLRYTLLQLWSPFCPPFGGEDGGWAEGPSYWSWIARVFARIYHLVESVTGVPIHQRSKLRRASLYKLYGNPPYFKLSPFGDGQAKPAPGGETMLLLSALYDDPYAKWYADWQHARLWWLDSVMFDTRKIQARAPYDLPQGRAFFDVGLAAMHTVLPEPTDNVAVLLRSSPFGSISHAYADQNAFVLDAYGEPLIIASGYYQLYAHPHHAQWTWQTKASNSVLVNGEGQNARDWNARGRLRTFVNTPLGDYVVGDAHQAYGGRLERFDRHIVFLRPPLTGGEPIIVLRDDLAAPRAVTYQFLLHALNEMGVDAPGQRILVHRGQARCAVDFLRPQDLRFEQTDRFPVQPIRPAPNQWHLTASTTKPQAEEQSLIVLQPQRAGHEGDWLSAEVLRGRDCVGVQLSGDDRRLLVLLRTTLEPGLVSLEGVTTDAPAAAVSWVRKRPHAAVRFGGGALQVDGRDLAASDAVWEDTSWRSSAPQPPPLAVDGERVSWECRLHPLVRRVELSAGAPGPLCHRRVRLVIDNEGEGPLPVVVGAESATVRREIPAQGRSQEIDIPAVQLGGGARLSLLANETLGGRIRLREAEAAHVFGINLLPHASFEEVDDGKPFGWRAVTITRDAAAMLTSAPDARSGSRCARLTCTEATGGDFGAMLDWPGISASSVDRRFRMSCWVKTGADSMAGLQVAGADWTFWKNTPRLKDKSAWTQTSLEFLLPAGENITHVRIHASASRTGAEIFVDDVELVEVSA